jgi:hypothetical protein
MCLGRIDIVAVGGCGPALEYMIRRIWRCQRTDLADVPCFMLVIDS